MADPAATSVLPLLLTVQGLAVQFGGLRALDQLDIQVRLGDIHGLIGPNGSGKTTLMNVLSGLCRPCAGHLRFNGCALAGRSPAALAGAGIGRTFQTVQLFSHLSVLDHLLIGRHHALASRRLDVLLRPRRYQDALDRARARALELLQFVDLADVADQLAGDLPPGQQRLLEIARALALDPMLLLLDEPAAGLPAADVRHLVALIRKMRARGVTLLLIEHRMDVVMSVCNTISVLDFGRKIFDGTPAQARRNPRVIQAYVGNGRLEHAC
jgi:branched-chain amino acid transport system permease protein